MLGIDPEFGASVLRLWVAAGSAALLILFCVLALFQPQLRVVSSPARRAGFVLAGAVLGGVMAWAFLDHGLWGDASAERRAFETRAQQLNALALAPGSPLACLDALAGETVESACEKALFGSPASVAAASSYVASQLTLFARIATYAQRRGARYRRGAGAIAPLARNRPLRLRRPRACDPRRLHWPELQDARAFPRCEPRACQPERRYPRSVCGALCERFGARDPMGQSPRARRLSRRRRPRPTGRERARRSISTFPRAASIPAVSIMNPEPSGPVLPGVAAAAAANPTPAAAAPPSPRHARKQAASPAAATMTGQSATSTAVDPIWPEPMPTPPAGPAPPAASAPAAAAPVQLTPPLPNASAGAPARTQ